MTASVRRLRVAPASTATDSPLLPERVAALTRRATAGGASPVQTRAPATGAPIADLPQSDTADIEDAYARARAAQREWAQRPLRERTAVFARLHDLLLRQQAEILDIVQTETGKA